MLAGCCSIGVLPGAELTVMLGWVTVSQHWAHRWLTTDTLSTSTPHRSSYLFTFQMLKVTEDMVDRMRILKVQD